MKVLSCAEMLVSSSRSIDVGTVHSRRHKMSWERLFSEVNTGALFVVRNCELLFSDSVMNVGTLGYIIHQLKRSTSTFIFVFDGQFEHGDVVNLNQAQKGLLHLFHFVIRFEKPSLSMRTRLWKSLVPKNTPVMSDVDFDELSKQFSDFVQTDIMATIHMAAATACLRQKGDCILKMEDLLKAGERHKEKRLSKDFRGIIYT
ncbi:hypothetical protein RFI_15107 [Reticulomyxa filosa]|uniref:Uncharacterized protein n=1 Tax=Reticulomyxa filosa TaxID=46433 RepID=X6N9W7_RETFI|nr:hypothetical protein RFI_15107 [Reticulomyxa filosa]|eukprot:ETO22097.1 hypothetical protein RFI_15107 [Reticulomyxa filosa]